jgi:hypothetical protein
MAMPFSGSDSVSYAEQLVCDWPRILVGSGISGNAPCTLYRRESAWCRIDHGYLKNIISGHKDEVIVKRISVAKA